MICIKDGTHAFWWKGYFKVLITLQENTSVVVESNCYSGRGECLQARQKGPNTFSGNEVQRLFDLKVASAIIMDIDGSFLISKLKHGNFPATTYEPLDRCHSP